MGYGVEAWLEWIGTVGWGELANAGGLFVAVAGIALTLAQLRLFRRQLKLDALIRIVDSNREVVSVGFEHPRVWTAMERSGETVSSSEALVRRRYLQLWTNHMQIMWAAWRLGLVPEREWAGYRQDLGEFFRTPALREHWTSVARFYPKGFRRLVTQLLEGGERDQ